MKTIKTLLFGLLLLIGLGGQLSAQTATTQTINTVAISATAAQITVASTTGFSATTFGQEYDMWVDGELMQVNSVNTTTGVIGVSRGRSPTRAGAHPTASLVFFGLVGGTTATGGRSPFINQNPAPGATCLSTTFAYLPLINPADGTISNCLATVGTAALGTMGTNAYGRWISYNFRQWSYGHPTTHVVDANYTATLADEFIIISRLTAARTITFPAITGVAGKTYVVINNTEGPSIVTLAGTANQGVGTTAGGTVTLSPSLNNNRVRLVSVATSAGGWSYATW